MLRRWAVRLQYVLVVTVTSYKHRHFLRPQWEDSTYCGNEGDKTDCSILVECILLCYYNHEL
jgi:hypothetical protein